MNTEYRTKLQTEISNWLGEDIRDWLVFRHEHDGASFTQIAHEIQGGSGYRIKSTTVSRWYFYWRTGR